jgi:hypothetical protein
MEWLKSLLLSLWIFFVQLLKYTSETFYDRKIKKK